MTLHCVLDYETRSEADLKKVGAYEYARHPSTEILCAAWTMLPDPELKLRPNSWAPLLGQGLVFLPGFERILTNPAITLVAHNAFFEQVVTRFVLPKYIQSSGLSKIPVSRWICTAALAATHALPRPLEGVCNVLKLAVRKDTMGKTLVRRHCKPRRPTKNNPSIWNEDPESLKLLVKYCETDVEAERELFYALPSLIPRERKIWCLNQRLNFRGVFIDRPLVQSIQKQMALEISGLTKEAQSLTGGIAVTQRDKLLKWCQGKGAALDNLQRKTVDDALAGGELIVPEPAHRVLSIRQLISKTSTKKYAPIEMRSRTDSRVHDLLLYHGASTGRDSGMGIQPHNFPARGASPYMNLSAEVLKAGSLEWTRALLGAPMDVFSGVLRGTIAATPGMKLFCGDFASIEARVLFWLAGHRKGLECFLPGRDPYKDEAVRIYKTKFDEVTPEQRDVGKRVFLGGGYGMGWAKFGATCELFGTPVTNKIAKLAIESYREAHYPVVSFWYATERAAIEAVQTGARLKVGKVTWFKKGKFLYCELPSGRRLAYFGPTIRFEKTPWGEMRPKLYHWGVDPKTKQWANSGTYGGRLVENITQAVARDIMMEAALRLDKAGYYMLLTVHDEALAECESGSVDEFEKLMSELPDWAKGCPVKVKAWSDERYRK